MARECAGGLVEAHRLTADGIFRTLALGVRVSRSASLARDAVARTIRDVLRGIERHGDLSIAGQSERRRRKTASGRRAA